MFLLELQRGSGCRDGVQLKALETQVYYLSSIPEALVKGEG